MHTRSWIMSIEPVEDWLVVRKVVKKRVFFFENKKAQPIPVVFGGWCITPMHNVHFVKYDGPVVKS